uniref:One cut domain family member n=1 Tax=Schistosoma mansoni TaxID=6183 RepID=A0A5K4EZ58_SCHMA
MFKNIEHLKQEHNQENQSDENYKLYPDKFETLYLIDSTKELLHPLSKSISGSSLSTSTVDINRVNNNNISTIDIHPQSSIHNFLPSSQNSNNSLSSCEYAVRTNSLTGNISTNPQTVSFQLSSNIDNSSNILINNENIDANENLLTNQQSTSSPSNYMKIQNYLLKTLDSPHDLSYTNSSASISQSSQIKLTNNCNLSDQLGITTYIDDNGQNYIITTSYSNQSKLKQKQQHIQDPRIELNFLCNQINNNAMISSSFNDYNNNINNSNRTTETQLPSLTNCISESFLSTDLMTSSSIDSTVAAASNVMSYIYQNGSLNYGNTEQLKNLNCLNIRTLNHWNSLEFNLNGSIDQLTNYTNSQLYEPNTTNTTTITTTSNNNDTNNVTNNTSNSDTNNNDNNHNVLRIDDTNNLLKLHQSGQQQQYPLQQLQSVNNSIISHSNTVQSNNLKNHNGLVTPFILEDVKPRFQESNTIKHNHNTSPAINTTHHSTTDIIMVGFNNSTSVNHQSSHVNDVNLKNTVDNLNTNNSNISTASNNNNNQPRTSFTENSNYRSTQLQNCYNYVQSEVNYKPDLKIQTSSMQHVQGHPYHPTLMNGSLVSSHMNNEALSLQKALSNMHARHDIISHSIQEMEEINTKVLAHRISSELKRYSIPQAVFAQRILCRSQGTLSDLLRNPKPWSKLKSGRETFRRMWKWLHEPEFQRMSALRLAGPVVCKRKESEHIKLAESRQPKKPRLVFTDIQRRTLQAIFKETKRPSKEMQSTIAQQLGLQVSTVANFFMNARRRSLDKWQEDTSKLSSTINSPSDSPYSRSEEHGQQSSMIHNLCCSQDGDFSNCTPYSLPSRRQPGCSQSITTPVSTLKTLDNSFIPGNPTELEQITRSNSLASCNSFTKPSNHVPLTSNFARTVLSNNNDKSDLFKCDNSRNNMITLEHRTFNALNSTDNPSTIPTVIYASQDSTCEQQQMDAENFSNNYSLHLTTQIQHSFPHQLQSQQEHQQPQQSNLSPSLLHRHHSQSSSHPMNTQLVPLSSSSSSASSSHHLRFPLDILDQNNGTNKYSTGNSRLHNSEHETIHNNNNSSNNNHNLTKSIYPYCNSQANYTSPVSGNLHLHHAHLNLFNTATPASTAPATIATTATTMTNVSSNNLIHNNNNQFLMRDLTDSQQFDHRFLSTMTSGQLTLTEQALELCSSLAAANAISFNNNNNIIHLTSEKPNHSHANSEIKLSHELNESVDINNIVFNNNNIHTENDVKSTDRLTNDISNNSNSHEDNNDDQHCHRQQQYHQIDLMSKLNLSINECNQLRLLPSNDLSRRLYFSNNEFIDQMKQTNNEIIDENNDTNNNNLNEVEDQDECVEDIDDDDDEEEEDEEDDNEEEVNAELYEDEAEISEEEDNDDDVNTINSDKKHCTRHDLNSNSND